jgi:peroxiredoxin
MGLELDGTGFGLGSRSQRYAAVIENGVVSVLGAAHLYILGPAHIVSVGYT